MQKMFRLLVIFFLVGLFFSGCNTIDTARQTLIAPESGKILFSDGFEDSASGWQTWSQEDSIIAYHQDGLRFIINEEQYDYWSRPGKWYEDVRIEVLATLVNGPSDNDFGLICRFRDDSNFYAFLASNDGYAGIIKVQDGIYQVISAPSLEYHPEIAQGQASNFLQAECVGPSLKFYVNNTLLAQANDSDFTAGDVGLIAGTYDTPGVDILFDNFVAVQP